MRVQAARMQSNDIAMGADHLALIILSKLDRSAREEWGSGFCTPLQAIRKKIPYNHVHNDTSITDMMGRLAGADAVRKKTDAPHKTKGNANAVTDSVGYLTSLLHNTTVESDTGSETAYTASTSRESFPDQSTLSRRSRGRRRHNKKVKAGPPREKKSQRQQMEGQPMPPLPKIQTALPTPQRQRHLLLQKKIQGMAPGMGI